MKKLILILLLTLIWPAVPQVQQMIAAPISEVAASEVELRATHGGIEITNRTGHTIHIQIYSITGQTVKNFDMADGHLLVELPQGCYIVRHSQGTHKLIVR
mgnify:FL=1